MTTRRRASSLGPHDMYLLDEWGRQLETAFGECPYFVGSASRAEDNWRDVDLRMLCPETLADASPLMLRVINLAISLWGRQVTGLPIDFQIQPAEEFHSYDHEVRNPMGGRSKSKWNLGQPFVPTRPDALHTPASQEQEGEG